MKIKKLNDGGGLWNFGTPPVSFYILYFIFFIMLEKRITLHKWYGMGWNKSNPSGHKTHNHFCDLGSCNYNYQKKKKSLSTLLILFIYFKNRDGNRFN